jgi:hypothetical protein
MKNTTKGIILLFLIAISTTAYAELPEITQVNYTPSPGVPGTTINLLVQIENKNAQTQKEVQISLENAYPFTIKTGDTQSNPRIIGDIEPYGKALAQFTLYIDPTAENKTYYLQITTTEKSTPSGKKTPHAILVNGKEPLIKVTSITTEKLLPGQEKEIAFELHNIGTSPAYDIILEMQEDRTVTTTGTVVERDISPLGAAATYLESINPGEKKTANLKISVSNTATIKNYVRPIIVSYRNAAGTRTNDTSYVGLKVYGDAILDATLKEQTNNGKNEITIEIFNKGLGKAEYTTVEIQAENAQIEKPKQFIGSLGPNDVDTVKTGIKFNNAGTNKLKINIEYQNADATQKKTTLEIPITTQTTTQEGPNYVLILIILIIIGIIVWNYKIRKK